ncbi:hypothetical protein LPB67_14190 [Undibacterium sp. Jales W-56]|uniref:hypothetical protein n=1 Tax=Undibacterium sp. Jales W-56 TaxID=2897325 RepID=UPI0021D12F84|nr:hypothetical protein [Undibacterium sp. Jales W-56]MCU6434923.1 hypothetical protein [Undibacterium sp. Jales W-56]
MLASVGQQQKTGVVRFRYGVEFFTDIVSALAIISVEFNAWRSLDKVKDQYNFAYAESWHESPAISKNLIFSN